MTACVASFVAAKRNHTYETCCGGFGDALSVLKLGSIELCCQYLPKRFELGFAPALLVFGCVIAAAGISSREILISKSVITVLCSCVTITLRYFGARYSFQIYPVFSNSLPVHWSRVYDYPERRHAD